MSSIMQSAFLAGILLVQNAAAHGWVQGILAEGKYYPGQSHWSTDVSPGWKADNGDTGFATSLTDQNIICHNNAVPGTIYVAVNAGSKIELQWNTWPDSHKGPMLDYLAPCGDDCTTVDKTGLQFTKIEESGLIDGTSNPQHWASDDLIANNFTWVTTIPAEIAPGKYVLRHETIALHSAGTEGGAQAYPQCINLEISGSGTNSLSSGTLGTKLYTPTDPGILINIYRTLTSYQIPGPSVMAGGSSGSSSASATASTSVSATRPVSTSSKSVAVSATPTSKINAVSSTSTAAPTTNGSSGSTPTASATIGGRKFICYEEF
ncbi:hypothetical protein H2198_003158 [Neophaeococcomyces mojaviensis]|uniref:Uncharacterized protein n=1 Tax=Neophaeococcomyces mojaviensis TaxID=3383035 RepID=A0ACC3AC86_9EURO|nr:hypothetical protein H2198_003158 [Knufia sp. JES_112]